MVVCPYDTCIYNSDKECSKSDVVLEVVDTETDYLLCKGYKRRVSEQVEEK